MAAYSQTTGRVEATQIAEAVQYALHTSDTSVSLSGLNIIDLRCETYVVDRDREGPGYNRNIIFSSNAGNGLTAAALCDPWARSQSNAVKRALPMKEPTNDKATWAWLAHQN